MFCETERKRTKGKGSKNEQFKRKKITQSIKPTKRVKIT